MNKINRYGLTNDEYINLIKECSMTTKKWTLSKLKEFHTKRLEIIHKRNKVTGIKKLIKIFKKIRGKNE